MIEKLRHIDYSRILFDLEFQEDFLLKRDMLLRLRREFRRALGQLAPDDVLRRQIDAMIDPGVSADPYARRHYQKPSPPFVIRPRLSPEVRLDAGDNLQLEVVFVGDPGQNVSLFCSLLRQLGRLGIFHGEGRFELVGLCATDSSGSLALLPLPDDGRPAAAVPRTPLAWWVEEKMHFDKPATLDFLTPARLVSGNRPLFTPTFAELFPFVLRRVTSMLHAWGGGELTDDARYLVEQAGAAKVLSSDLHWQDWRSMDGGDVCQDVGGFVGRLVLESFPVDDLFVVTALGSLFNIGKGASCGSGFYLLD